MKSWFRQSLRKILPEGIRAGIYALLFRFESLKTGFWRTSRKKFPAFYGFLQAIVERIYLQRLYFIAPETHRRLTQAGLPKHLLRTLAFRLALNKNWRKFPALPDSPRVETDVLFVSYSAHPDLLKMCIALKRARPGVRCTLVAGRDAHTQNLCKLWFDEVIVLERGHDLSLLAAIQHARAKVIVMRFRDVVFHTLALLYSRTPLIYYPSGGFLSSMSGDFLVDPELSFDEIFEADKFLLERVQGIMHFLSDGVIDWFKEKGVNITCPSATVYTACLPELSPAEFLPKLSAQDGEWHIVHATGVETVNRDPRTGGGAFLPIEKCRIVVEQGIHLHVYGTYFDRKASGYAPYVELERQSKYFHIENNLEFDQLLVEMTKYDLAWKHWDLSAISFWPIYFDYVTPNFFAYLQSGLPLLMSDKMPFRERDLALAHNLGILIKDPDLENVAAILDQHKENIKSMGKAVREASTGVLSYQIDNLLKVVGPYLDK